MKKVIFTAKQLSLVTQFIQVIGVVLVAKGMVANSDWELYFGALTSLIGIVFALYDGGNNDRNTARMQEAVGAKPDAKPSIESVTKAREAGI